MQATNDLATATRNLSAAMRRAESVFDRRPEMGLHDDAPAAARWESGTRITTRHANGTELSSDMPSELGGTGDRITPGWLFRAGLAACATTTIVMAAAAQGIELSKLEVRVTSRSDTRGLLGMQDGDGERVSACPRDIVVTVDIAAQDVAPERLRAVVDEGLQRSPISNALRDAVPTELQVITRSD